MCTRMGAVVVLYLHVSMWYVVQQYTMFLRLFWVFQCRELTKQEFKAVNPSHQTGNFVYTCSVGMQSISQAVVCGAINISPT